MSSNAPFGPPLTADGVTIVPRLENGVLGESEHVGQGREVIMQTLLIGGDGGLQLLRFVLPLVDTTDWFDPDRGFRLGLREALEPSVLPRLVRAFCAAGPKLSLATYDLDSIGLLLNGIPETARGINDYLLPQIAGGRRPRPDALQVVIEMRQVDQRARRPEELAQVMAAVPWRMQKFGDQLITLLGR